jgi:Protein of unknown function (DUF3995)
VAVSFKPGARNLSWVIHAFPTGPNHVKFTPAILTMLLVALAALHAWWGIGGRWPGHDERSLVELVIGRTRSMRMPSLIRCMLVASALFAAAGLVALQGKVIAVDFGMPGQRLVETGFWMAGAVFALRGLAGFIPPIFGYARGTPFAALNRVFYSPLCLLIAAGFAVTGTGIG